MLEMRAAHFQHNNFPHGGCWVECEAGSSPLFHTSTSPLGRQSRAGDVGWSVKQARRRCSTLQLPSLWGGRAARTVFGYSLKQARRRCSTLQLPIPW